MRHLFIAGLILREMLFKIVGVVCGLVTLYACEAQSIAPRGSDTVIVNFDNHNIYLYTSGKGKYTVVMEAGLGANHKCWQAVDTSIARKAKVVTYDRPGYLNSGPCSKTRDAITVSHELKQALRKANIPPPYILVGWSLGGSFVRVYAGQFPQDVIGLVLVDPAPEESYARFSKECPELLYEDSLYTQEVLKSNRLGEKGEVIAYDTSMVQARNSDNRYFAPVKLLISLKGKAPGNDANNPDNPINRIWVEELKKWAARKQNVFYKIVPNSGHHVARDNPNIVIETVFELMGEIGKAKQ